MFAVIAAVILGLALVLDIAEVSLGEVLTSGNLVTAGLFCIALHLAGVGVSGRPPWRSRSGPRRR